MARLKAGITATAIALGSIAAANGVAYAATGHAFVLGESNLASTTTTLTRTTNGVPLVLNARSGYAPLAVNSTKRVTKLNADMVDGLHASSLQLHAIKYLLPTTASGTAVVNLSGLAPGVYLASIDAIVYSGTTNDRISCAIADSVHHNPQVTGDATLDGHVGQVTASGVLDARQGTFQLTCGGGVGPLNFLASPDSVISLTKISGVTSTNATP